MRITAKVAVGFLFFLGGIGLIQAAEVVEVESNNTIDAAQLLTMENGSVTVRAATNVVRDVDFYKFRAVEGDLVDIEIKPGGRASSLALFDGDFKVKREGSRNIAKGYIDKTGYWYIGAVVPVATFDDGGTTTGVIFPITGPYTLVISGVSDPIMQISIDVKPDTRERARFNPKSQGKVAVALLSSGEFVPGLVDEPSLTFGATGNERSYSHCNPVRRRDLNKDGIPDLVCHFDNKVTGFGEEHAEGVLRGRLIDGREFEGRGPLKVILPVDPH